MLPASGTIGSVCTVVRTAIRAILHLVSDVHRLDFADAYLVASAERSGIGVIASSVPIRGNACPNGASLP